METELVAIHVTDAHIAAGVRGDCARCPVALALAEHIKPGINVHVYDTAVFWRGLEDIQTIDLPQDVYVWTGTFDYDVAYWSKPISFELPIRKDLLRRT